MSNYDDNFFEGKRTWSLIKDQVLSSYMPVYMNKVKDKGKHIVLIDGYAGPGIFDDHSKGSPMIICSAAERFAKGRYDAYFYNIKRDFHLKLESVLQYAGWSSSAHCHLGDSLKHISQIPQILNDDTIFLYLDPFGLKGCSFHQLEPFLIRNPNSSTEIVLTMCMPVVHRLAAFHAIKRGEIDHQIESYHRLLTLVFGGDYWREILFREDIDAETKEYQLISMVEPH